MGTGVGGERERKDFASMMPLPGASPGRNGNAISNGLSGLKI